MTKILDVKCRCPIDTMRVICTTMMKNFGDGKKMANKTSKTLRLSDDVIELIDRQQGESFTQKFENLVTRCVFEVQFQEKRLEDLRQQIEEEYERLRNLQKVSEQLRFLEQDLQGAKRYFDIVQRRAKAIAESFEDS